MATITEDYISFEVAKLLKEKGFDYKEVETFLYPHKFVVGYIRRYKDSEPILCCNLNGIHKSEDDYECVWAITHQLACKWLRKKYNIVISVNPQKDKYSFTPWQLRGSEWVYVKEMLPLYDKYEFACNAAIRYCLENLI